MPQLTGSEQRILSEVLVEHIDLKQLARMLEHNDLPSLEQLAGNSDLRDSMSKVIQKLSRQYRILKLVEGALSELDGSCPPLQTLVEQNRDEWERRRKSPPKFWEILDTRSGPHTWRRSLAYFVAIGVLIASIVAYFQSTARDNSDSIVEVVDLSFIENEMTVNADGSNRSDRIQKLDVKVVNRGQRPTVLKSFRLRIEEKLPIPIFFQQTAYLDVSSTYTITIPTDRAPPFDVELPISHSLKPDEVDRFQVLLKSDSGPMIFQASLQILFDEESNSTASERFSFAIVPQNVVPSLDEPFNTAELYHILQSHGGVGSETRKESFLLQLKATLPELKKLDGAKTSKHFQQIIQIVQNAPTAEEFGEFHKREVIYGRLRRAFFLQVFGSLIHPDLVPSVFDELRKLGHSEFDTEMQQRLVAEYEKCKGIKLEWLRNDVQGSWPPGNVSAAEFLLAVEIRLSDNDMVRVEKDAVRNEIDFIYGKLQGLDLRDAMVLTFVKGSLESRLMTFGQAFPTAKEDKELAASLLTRAVFEQLELIGNSRKNLEVALEQTARRLPWTALASEHVIAGIETMIGARREWIDSALVAMDNSSGAIELALPQQYHVPAGTRITNTVTVTKADQQRLRREKELLIDRPSDDEKEFKHLIVRFAAQNVWRVFQQSSEDL